MQGLIESDPRIMMGKPVVSGTRITVELILREFAAGRTTGEIIYSHPQLTAETIRAALLYAAEAVRTDIIYPIRSDTE